MSKSRPGVILFDLGRVLIDIYPDQTMQRLAERSGRSLAEFRKEFLSGNHLQVMAGITAVDTYLQRFQETLKLDIPLEELREIWNSLIGPLKPGIDPLVRTLAESYRLAICSNTDPSHWETARGELGSLLDLFDQIFLSYEMGLNKPDPTIYRRVLQQLDTPADSVYFIDDTLENVESAGKVGMRIHHFTSVEDLRDDLQNNGIL